MKKTKPIFVRQSTDYSSIRCIRLVMLPCSRGQGKSSGPSDKKACWSRMNWTILRHQTTVQRKTPKWRHSTLMVNKACTAQGTLPARIGNTWVDCCIIITIISGKCLMATAEEGRRRLGPKGEKNSQSMTMRHIIMSGLCSHVLSKCLSASPLSLIEINNQLLYFLFLWQ
jgi:hypothetical protein